MEYLVESGADINFKDNDGWIALIFASENEREEVVEYLQTRGAK